MRTAHQLLKAWDEATEEKPLVLDQKEGEIFRKALKTRNRSNFQPGFQIAKDYEGYNCPVTGKWIEGRVAHRENLKRQGCRLFETGELQEFIRNKPKDVERNAEIFADQICEKIGQRIGDL